VEISEKGMMQIQKIAICPSQIRRAFKADKGKTKLGL
jgi:hypothetical protein